MITVVFQGNNFSKKIIDLINLSPNFFSQIIVSTWKHEKIESKLDESITVVKLDDPGPDFINGKSYNYTRHILGVLEGLKNSKNKYTLKLRSDIILDFEKLLNEIDYDRLNVIDVTTKIYGSFHFCDWLYFAKTDELFRMYKNFNFALLKWASIEEILFIKYVSNKNLKSLKAPKIIYHKNIKLKSTKPGYRFIPFGKNIVLKPSKKRIDLWNAGNYDLYFNQFNSRIIFRYFIYKFYRFLIIVKKCF